MLLELFKLFVEDWCDLLISHNSVYVAQAALSPHIADDAQANTTHQKFRL